MRAIKLILAYDGTDFHGWQRQVNVRTVQAELERTAARVLQGPVSSKGASRTDAGVHALGQVARLLTDSPIPIENLRRALADRLPADMALRYAAEAPPEFDPAGHALGKLYRYRICNRQTRPVEPHVRRYCWHVWYRLDLEAMRSAAHVLVGTHDFAAFAGRGSPRESTVRAIRRFDIRRSYDELLIDVDGDGFLYNQVRNMVGTLVEIGRGHWPAERMSAILASRDRRTAGPTAPPHGLCLQWVRYPPQPEAADGT